MSPSDDFAAKVRALKQRRPSFNSRAGEPITPESVLRYADSYTRIPFLLVLVQYCTPQQWFRLLGDAWSVCDNIGKYTDKLRIIFSSSERCHIEMMMNDEERAAHAALPDTFVAWRGCYALNNDGFSYSLDRNVATKFPTLSRYRAPGWQPLLLTANVRRSECVVKLDRNEHEVIAFAPEVISRDALKRSRRGT